MSYELEDCKGLLVQGDLIILEVNGIVVPKRPTDKTPQVFVVLKDQLQGESVDLAPYEMKISALVRPRRLKL